MGARPLLGRATAVGAALAVPPEEVKEEKDPSLEPSEQDSQTQEQRQMKEMVELRRRLEAHYALMKNFIRTRSEPTIFYLPAKHTAMTQEYLEETHVAIQQKIASLKAHLHPAAEVASSGERDDDDEVSVRESRSRSTEESESREEARRKKKKKKKSERKKHSKASKTKKKSRR